MDEACKIHDIEYSKFSDSENRRRADKDLAERAWQRFKAGDSSVGEKAAAWAVTTAMKAKTAIGGGKKRKRNSKKINAIVKAEKDYSCDLTKAAVNKQKIKRGYQVKKNVNTDKTSN